MKECSKCGAALPFSYFYNSPNRRDGLYAWCKRCWSGYQSARMKDPERKQLHASYRAKKQKMVWDYLLAHPCVDCGESDPVVLEFDHQDNTNKVAAISTLLSKNRPWEIISAEIEKCDIRCANCHRRRTAKQQGFYKNMPLSSTG